MGIDRSYNWRALQNVWIGACMLSAILASAQGNLAAPLHEAQVDQLFALWDRPASPGCAISIMQNGRIAYRRGYGIADLDHDVPITPSTVFHVASISKQFTAAAVVLLAQEGKLSFDNDVRKYLPELPRFSAPITIRQLLYHTSGLRDQWDLLDLAGWRYSLDLITDDDVLSLIKRQKALNFKPGDRRLYSNTGYTLLALIVNRVSGQSFRSFTTASIFAPLGMEHTHFRDDHAEIVHNQAYGYERFKDGTFRLSVTNFDTVGATSLLTTVEDLARWDENFYTPIVGGPNLINQIQQVGTLNSGIQTDYGFGLVVGRYRGLRTIGHGGADAGYRADMVHFPDQHFGVAVLCNSADAVPESLTRKVADIYLETLFREPAFANAKAAVSEKQLVPIAGLYWNRESDEFYKISFREGKLWITRRNKTAELTPINEFQFRLEDSSWQGEAQFDFEGTGQNGRFIRTLDGRSPTPFELVTPFDVSKLSLKEYAGNYRSEEIDAVYRVSVQRGKLILDRLKNDAEVLQLCTRDVAMWSQGTIRFTRGADRKVIGILLSTGRVLNFSFVKVSERENLLR